MHITFVFKPSPPIPEQEVMLVDKAGIIALWGDYWDVTNMLQWLPVTKDLDGSSHIWHFSGADVFL